MLVSARSLQNTSNSSWQVNWRQKPPLPFWKVTLCSTVTQTNCCGPQLSLGPWTHELQRKRYKMSLERGAWTSSSISFLYSKKDTDLTGHPSLQSCNVCSPSASPGGASAVLGAAQLQEMSHIFVPFHPTSVSFFLSHCSIDDTTLITNLFLQSLNKLNIMNVRVTTFFLLKKQRHNKVWPPYYFACKHKVGNTWI